MQYIPIIVIVSLTKPRNTRLSTSLISNLTCSFIPKRVIGECNDILNSTVTYRNIRRKLCAFGQLRLTFDHDYMEVLHARRPLKTCNF